MQIHLYQPKLRHYIDMKSLEPAMREAFYERAREADYSIVDYADGDFYYRINLNDNDPLIVELAALLPAEVVEANRFGIFFYQ